MLRVFCDKLFYLSEKKQHGQSKFKLFKGITKTTN